MWLGGRNVNVIEQTQRKVSINVPSTPLKKVLRKKYPKFMLTSIVAQRVTKAHRCASHLILYRIKRLDAPACECAKKDANLIDD